MTEDNSPTFEKLKIRVLSISSDRGLFDETSQVRKRLVEYSSLVEELHIVVFSQRAMHFEITKIAENAWVYPTHSLSRFLYIFDAVRIATKISRIELRGTLGGADIDFEIADLTELITVQDPYETGLAGAWLAKKLNRPLQVQIHTDVFSPYFKTLSVLNRVRVWIARRVIRRATTVRVVSGRVRDSIMNTIRFGIGDFPRIDTLPIFVDVEKIKSFEPKSDLRKKYPQFKYILLMAGRLEHEKGFDLAFQFLPGLLRKNKDWGLVVVGRGSMRAKLEQKAEKADVREKVIFENWTDDILSYYKTADIFLSLSQYEGYGMALVEAVASGCPVATTDVGIVGEVLDPVHSLVCAPKNMKCFETQLGKIMEDKVALEQFKNLAREARGRLNGSTKEEYLMDMQNTWKRTVHAWTSK